jgi:hypothetical protein
VKKYNFNDVWYGFKRLLGTFLIISIEKYGTMCVFILNCNGKVQV